MGTNTEFNKAAMLWSLAFFATFICAIHYEVRLLSWGTLAATLPPVVFIHSSFLCMLVGVMSLLGVPSGLWLATVGDVLAMLICIFVLRRLHLVKHRRLADKYDIVAYLSLIALVAFVFVHQFGIAFTPVFHGPDSATHCRLSLNIVKTGLVSGMYFNWYSAALWIWVLEPFLDSFYYYRVFMLVEGGFLLLGGLVFYSVVKVSDSVVIGLMSALMPVLYTAGYMSTVLIYGFCYLGTGVSIVAALLWMWSHKGIGEYRIRCAVTSLLLFGLIVCYSLFVPAVFLSCFAIVAHQAKSLGWSFVKIALIEVLIYVTPVVLGYLLSYAGTFHDSVSVSSAINTDGDNYRNLFGNFIVLIPVVVYGFMQSIIRKANQLSLLVLTLFIVFTVIMFAATVARVVSPYYFYKCHHLLWLLCFIVGMYGLQVLAVRERGAFVAYSITWLLLFAVAVSGLDEKLSEKRPDISADATSVSLFDVYVSNLQASKVVLVTEDEMDLFKVYYDYLNEEADSEAVVVGGPFSIYWFNVVSGRNVMANAYWNFTDDGFEAKVRECKYITVMTSDVGVASFYHSLDGTSSRPMSDKFIDCGEIVFSNEQGAVVRVGEL